MGLSDLNVIGQPLQITIDGWRGFGVYPQRLIFQPFQNIPARIAKARLNVLKRNVFHNYVTQLRA
jgi:hypothetical protein